MTYPMDEVLPRLSPGAELTLDAVWAKVHVPFAKGGPGDNNQIYVRTLLEKFRPPLYRDALRQDFAESLGSGRNARLQRSSVNFPVKRPLDDRSRSPASERLSFSSL